MTGCENSKMHTNSFDGTKLEYTRAGSGDIAIAFIHGWCCNKDFWKYQLPYFEKNYEVISLDLAGYGNSDVRIENSFDAWGKDVLSVIKEVNPEKYILVGHSSGGYVVLNAAMQADNKLLAIVGVDSYRGKMEYQYSDSVAIASSEEVSNLSDAQYKEYINDIDRWFVPSSDTSDISWIKREMVNCLKETAAEGIREYYRYMNRRAEDFNDLGIKIFGINKIHSKFDTAFFSKPGIDFTPYYVNNVGHFVMMDDVETFNLLLEDIIKSLK